MKINGTIVQIPIEWTSSDLHSFFVEGATYPEETNELPLISIQTEQTQVLDFVVKSIRKTEFSQHLQENLTLKFPAFSNLVSLRKLKERGNEITFIDIFPIQYDSISGKYFRVDYLEIELLKTSGKSTTSNLRTSDQYGNSVLASGNWYKIAVTKTGVHKIDYDYLKNAG
ncbi:MAG: hypothetical protein KAI29_19850, partial [Cyclobacteriaceae bacterium]|nr:hypothetical protein [Cyclobacteriaceae bacterium]